MKIVKQALIILFLMTVSFNVLSQTNRNSIESFDVKSEVLDETRRVYVSKPLGYETSDENFFVVYVLDGESSIDYTKAITELLYQNGYPKLLVVAIPNTFRNRDLTPTAWREAEDGGGSEAFLKFMKKELIPAVESRYRTHSYRVLIGHSLGGLFASYAMVNETSLFDGLIAISPSVFYDDFLVFKDIQKLLENNSGQLPEFYFAMGEEPGEEGDGILTLNDYLVRTSPKDLNWAFDRFSRETHSTVPLVGTLDGLRYIFRDFNVEPELLDQGLKAIIKHFENLSKKYRKNTPVPQRVLMTLSDRLWSSGNEQKAIDVVKYYAEIYPNMIIPYDYLSEYYSRQNKIDLAIQAAQKMLDILPGYRHAEEKLARLKGIKHSASK